MEHGSGQETSSAERWRDGSKAGRTSAVATEVPAAVRALSCFAGEGEGIAGIEKLAGGLQNTNFKVTREDGAAVVVRVPSDDASQQPPLYACVQLLAFHKTLCDELRPECRLFRKNA